MIGGPRFTDAPFKSLFIGTESGSAAGFYRRRSNNAKLIRLRFICELVNPRRARRKLAEMRAQVSTFSTNGHDSNPVTPSARANVSNLAAQFWELSCDLIRK